MRLISIRIAIFLGAVVVSSVSWATDFLAINDFGQVKWQMTADGKVYLRNINEFDSSFLGCCYNYYIDTSTEPGKVMFSAFLSFQMASKSGNIGFPNKNQAGAINYIGKW